MAARKQFLLRVDPELWKELEKWAADELRSVNAQVESGGCAQTQGHGSERNGR